MTDLGKYCCFNCPSPDFTERRLTDACATCGREFGFPLTDVPSTIGNFDVERSIGRGFYGATFVARRRGPIKTPRVLKVSPVAMYKYFQKSFEEEVEQHARVAAYAEHVVAIEDVFDAEIQFGDTRIPCHVMELQHIEGAPLQDYINGSIPLSAAEASQIACDLFRMKEEFERSLANHNDLHAANIMVQRLPAGFRRPDAIEPRLRTIAIDLGSVTTDRRSGGRYLGDLHWIGQHVQNLADRLLAAVETFGDLESRMALKLQSIAQGIIPATEHQRTPSAEDFIKQIRDEYYRTAEPWRPWRSPLILKTFQDSYNAQTLDAWYVPQLFVDPDGTWLSKVSAPGPLVLTGMRGCGKTMLIRSLQFHARAVAKAGEQDSKTVARLRDDGYVGLFVSAQRLLPSSPATDITSVEKLFARLYVAYASEAARSIAHLQDIDENQISANACKRLIQAVKNGLLPEPKIEDPDNIEQLERSLTKLLIEVGRSDSIYELAAHPSTAFPNLAEEIRTLSPLWASAHILFLLDDVSTRYLTPQRIEELLSALIFQSPVCAFKLTSEAQTIFLSLKSPGQIHLAAPGRDFTTFDLGSEVHSRLKKGRTLVADILNARASLYAGHPQATPKDVLGDVDLESIASTIVSTQRKSKQRKTLYRGITALTGVCVGDIGSVIQIYQQIISKASKTLPISDQHQNEAFQDFCSRYLYQLDRRHSDLKVVATTFAEASHELLMQSGQGSRTGRLRQYTSIYVRVTSGDLERQVNRLRELVDAGIFVFTGGAPRTKTHDSNPTQQFKLTYRKIYGLANFIGLSERDRFELSGSDLEEWLANPAEGKQILLRNLANRSGPFELNDINVGDEPPVARELDRSVQSPQLLLPNGNQSRIATSPTDAFELLPPPLPNVQVLSPEGLRARYVDTLVLGLGFEERTRESAERLLNILRPAKILAVVYPSEGFGTDVRESAERRGIPIEYLTYAELRAGADIPELGSAMIDITGLAKPALFNLVRSTLKKTGSVQITYTRAQNYYPLEAELESVLQAYSNQDHHSLLSSLKHILTGEAAPYKLRPLLSIDSDRTRLRALFAFGSAKHERLLHLIEAIEYDAVRILVDNADTSRAKVAEIAAMVALEGREAGGIIPGDATDPQEVISILGKLHHEWFVRDGFNFEIGLTGNKIEALASAALSAFVPINEVWYVEPGQFDERRFTEGVGKSSFYSIDILSPRSLTD